MLSVPKRTIVILLVLWGGSGFCPSQEALGAENSKDTSESEKKGHFQEVKRKRLNDALVVSLECSKKLSEIPQVEMKREAERIVGESQGERIIRVFFYDNGERPESGIPLCRFEWTNDAGMKMTYDRSRPRIEDKTVNMESLPAYEILSEMTDLRGRHFGDILVPSFTPKTDSEEVAAFAKKLAQAKGFDHLTIYCLRDAYKANMSAEFLKKHPTALKEGMLGVLDAGKFSDF